MAETAASTAYGPIAIAASEHLMPQQRIIDDAIAYQMLPTSVKLIMTAFKWKPARDMFYNLTEKSTPGIYGEMVCRKRFIENKVLEALGDGIDAVVILGAGLDTLAYRLPQLAAAHVYEVDLPVNTDYKRRKLESIYGVVPAHVKLVPVDFEDQTLETALQRAGYTFDQRGFFVWEGVTQYLSEAAVRDTFQLLAKAKDGSRLIFTYVQKDFIEGRRMFGAPSLYQRFRVKSQLWKFGLDPQQVEAFVGEYGWDVIEQLGPEAFIERYVKPSGRQLAVSELEISVYAQKRQDV